MPKYGLRKWLYAQRFWLLAADRCKHQLQRYRRVDNTKIWTDNCVDDGQSPKRDKGGAVEASKARVQIRNDGGTACSRGRPPADFPGLSRGPLISGQTTYELHVRLHVDFPSGRTVTARCVVS